MTKPKPYTYWLFCDESGNLATKSTNYLIAVAVGTRNPDLLRKVVVRTRKMYRMSRGEILHATDLGADTVCGFLNLIAQVQDLTLSIAILDKQWLWNRQAGYEHLYDLLFAYLLQKAIPLQNDTTEQPFVILERRKKYKSALLSAIEKSTGLERRQIQLCAKDDRQWGQQLSVADAIAWSTYQKYEKQQARFFEIFQDRVQFELLLGVDGSGIMRPTSEMNN